MEQSRPGVIGPDGKPLSKVIIFDFAPVDEKDPNRNQVLRRCMEDHPVNYLIHQLFPARLAMDESTGWTMRSLLRSAEMPFSYIILILPLNMPENIKDIITKNLAEWSQGTQITEVNVDAGFIFFPSVDAMSSGPEDYDADMIAL